MPFIQLDFKKKRFCDEGRTVLHMPQSACAASAMETAPGATQPLGTTELIFSGAKDGLTYVFLTLPPPAVQSIKKKDQISSFWENTKLKRPASSE